MKFLVKHAMQALYPTTEHGPGIDQTHLDDFLARYRREAPPAMYAGLLAASLAFEFTPPLTVGQLKPAFLLSPEALDAHADRLTRHDAYAVRQLMLLIKLAAGLCWGADAQVREGMNLRPYPADPGTWQTT